jgi:hypothetical protein
MTGRVQLKHPRGKKAVTMSEETYDLLKPSLLNCLRGKGEATFTEILEGCAADLKRAGTPVKGSLAWHLEWVKLDLEARKLIRRSSDSTPQKYRLSR